MAPTTIDPIPILLAVYGLLSLALVAWDIATLTVPDTLTIGGVMVGALIHLLVAPAGLPPALLRATIAGVFFYLVWRYTKGFGFGDVKLIYLIAFYLSPPTLVLTTLAMGALSMALLLPQLLFHHLTRTTRLPLAPFVMGGSWVALVYAVSMGGPI